VIGPAVVLKRAASALQFRLLIRTLHRVSTKRARPSQLSLAAAGVFCGRGLVMPPNALRIIFGPLHGVLDAFFIAALLLMSLRKAMEQTSEFVLRFSPALQGTTH
jgi:hypothetical protein